MTERETIPESVREIAEAIVRDYGSDPDGLMVGAMCAAILEAEKRGEQRERERLERAAMAAVASETNACQKRVFAAIRGQGE